MKLILNKEDVQYQQCTLSLLDNIFDPNITFDKDGISNYYYDYLNQSAKLPSGDQARIQYENYINQIKKDGKSKQFDCIIGVSGGVDSSYLSLIAKREGLRVLLVHFDNGWNSELAVHNIHKIVEKTGFDLYTYVIDWEEFKDIQLSYFKAGVIDIEAVTDIAIFDALDWICRDKKIGYILDGRNFQTESVLPVFWTNKNPNNLYDIHSKFGTKKLFKYPAKFKNGRYVAPLKYFKNIPLLNLLDYNKSEVKKELIQYLEWKDYGGKHYESVFTRFYQGYILPHKFFVDKRKAHLSNLIFNGQISKEEAIEEISLPIYDERQLNIDLPFVLKKLGLSEKEFDDYMKKPFAFHDDYNNTYFRNDSSTIRKILGKIKRRIIN